MGGKTKQHRWIVRAAWVALILGICLGWFVNEAWLGRFGALIIVFGIWLGALRLPDFVRSRIKSFLDEHFEDAFEGALADLEQRKNRPATEDERFALRTQLRDDATRALTMEGERSIFKFVSYELTMLIGGTLINGFGEYVLLVLKKMDLNQ